MPENELTIHGYELPDGHLVVAADALVESPGFWPAYLYSLTRHESVWAAFASDMAGCSAVTGVLSDRQAWPAISLRLAPAARNLWYWLRVVYRNFPDDAGVDFLVTSDLGGTAITIASVEGHFRGPGLCWAELRALAEMADPVLSPAQRLVLALPLLGDTGIPGYAGSTVVDALTAIGAVEGADALAGDLLANPSLWSHADWEIREGVRMCRGGHAVRHVQDLSLNHLRQVDKALGGRYYRSRKGSREYGPRTAGRTMPRWRFEVAESRVDSGAIQLRGQLDGEIRDSEPALLVEGDLPRPIGAIRLEFEDNATGQLVIAIRDTGIQVPAPGATLYPLDSGQGVSGQIGAGGQ